jgi:hypothetical protein
MKVCGFVGLLILATATGCVSLPKTFPQQPVKANKVEKTADKPKRPPAITADQVTEANAHQATQALIQELDRDTPASGGEEK